MVQLDLFSRPQRMHRHSIIAHASIRPKKLSNAQIIYNYIKEVGECTVLDIMIHFGWTNPNKCAPRVSEMVKWGKLIEIEKVYYEGHSAPFMKVRCA